MHTIWCELEWYHGDFIKSFVSIELGVKAFFYCLFGKSCPGQSLHARKGKNHMKNYQKYQKQYFMPPVPSLKWAQKETVEQAPTWCSVDLRDGNQSLIVPMLSLIHISARETAEGLPF